MHDVEKYLSGGDLRSIKGSNYIVKNIKSQKEFDVLFSYLLSTDRLQVMRAADAIEKISRLNPEWLSKHKASIFKLLTQSENKELKWHLAQLCPRLTLTSKEKSQVWKELNSWAFDSKSGNIVRVNALQGLYELSSGDKALERRLREIASELKTSAPPSFRARLRKLKL